MRIAACEQIARQLPHWMQAVGSHCGMNAGASPETIGGIFAMDNNPQAVDNPSEILCTFCQIVTQRKLAPMNLADPISNILARQHGMITSRQISTLSISRTTLSRYVKQGLLERVRTGVYATSEGLIDDLLLMRLFRTSCLNDSWRDSSNRQSGGT